MKQNDAILWVMPRTLPHKRYEGVSLEQRLQMLMRMTGGEPRFLVGVADGGLMVEIAHEARSLFSEARLSVLCGRDAAERFAAWDYGNGQSFAEMLREFDLLVARRQGEYEPPEELKHGIRTLPMPEEWDELSATEVRRRIRDGEEWEHLVPDSIVEDVRRLYS